MTGRICRRGGGNKSNVMNIAAGIAKPFCGITVNCILLYRWAGAGDHSWDNRGILGIRP